MRFVFITVLIMLFSDNSFAAPWDIAPTVNNTSATQSYSKAVQMQRGGTSSSLQTLPELEVTISASGLGKISAITLSEDGTLYTADKETGRIWSLSDRGQDGRIDLRRPLPYQFIRPTGLATIGQTLYVADQNAIWSIDPRSGQQEVATLKASNSIGKLHILRPSHDGSSLILGLTTQDQKLRILKIDIHTGQASLISESADGPLESFAINGGFDIWTATKNTLGPMNVERIKFMGGQSASDLILPKQYKKPLDWPAQLKDHIIVSQDGPGAMRLIAIPTEFGQISGEPRVLLEGFMNRSQRSAWGAPGVMAMDKRGLFVADHYNGTLLRLSPKPKTQPKVMIVDTDSLSLPPSEEPSLSPKNESFGISSTIKGTQINAKSTIVKPSNIEYGSKLIKDYDEKKALEEAEKLTEDPQKKRRMSRKRAQPDK